MSQIRWNVFERIKQWLCSRRNKQAILNPLLYKQKQTQPIVSQLKAAIIIDSDSDTEMEQNRSKMRRSGCRQEQEKQENVNKNINNQIKRSQHRISQYNEKQFKQLNNFQNQKDYDAYYLQLLIKKQTQMDSYIRQKQNLAAKLRQLFITNKQSQQYFWKSLYRYSNQRLTYTDSQILSKCEQYNQLQDSRLIKQYERDVQNIRQFKYTYEIGDYPEITFEDYKKIRTLWYQTNSKKNNQVIMNINLKILEKLTYRSFRTLSYGTWLNDEIINGYLQMLENKSLENNKYSKYKILNSFFAQTTFSKSPQMINRALKRKILQPRTRSQSQQTMVIIGYSHMQIKERQSYMTAYVNTTPKVTFSHSLLVISQETLQNLLKYSMGVNINQNSMINIHNREIRLIAECSCCVALRILSQAKISGASLRMILNINESKLPINC